MHTKYIDTAPAHRAAVWKSIDIVNAVRVHHLDLPTPCAGWNLLDLLAHMTVQHRGFAAAASGYGADPEMWRPETVRAAVADDPGTTYAAAATAALAAFATDGALEATFALPDFGPGATFPGAVAMGFHFVDYVVHGWDVAAALGEPFDLPPDVISAVLPLVLAVPDGDFRGIAGSPFAPALEPEGSGDLDRILRHLGRRPDWSVSQQPIL